MNMRYLIIAIPLLFSACGTPTPAHFMRGFCLENPSVGIPTHCESIQQIDAGDF